MKTTNLLPIPADLRGKKPEKITSLRNSEGFDEYLEAISQRYNPEHYFGSIKKKKLSMNETNFGKLLEDIFIPLSYKDKVNYLLFNAQMSGFWLGTQIGEYNTNTHYSSFWAMTFDQSNIVTTIHEDSVDLHNLLSSDNAYLMRTDLPGKKSMFENSNNYGIYLMPTESFVQKVVENSYSIIN